MPAAVSMPFLAPTSITPAHTARDVPNDPAFSFSKWIGKFLAIGQSIPRHGVQKVSPGDPPTEMQGYRASPTLQFMSGCLQMTWNCSAVSKFREMLSQPVISDQPPWTVGGLLLAVLLDG